MAKMTLDELVAQLQKAFGDGLQSVVLYGSAAAGEHIPKRSDFNVLVIVRALDIDLSAGFTVLTGETGAGKSILIDALQLALGNRADAGAVREGAERLDVSVEFDTDPDFAAWLDTGGFEAGDSLLLRRTVDLQGRSRGWINGSPATATQLREIGDRLLDIHGQHAWQSLTRPPAVRALIDAYAGLDTAALAAAWDRWKSATLALETARTRQADLDRERERMAWQIGEVDRLAPGADEWGELDAEHRKLAHAQALIEAVRGALGEHRGRLGAQRGDAIAGDELDQVAPVGADVGERARRSP